MTSNRTSAGGEWVLSCPSCGKPNDTTADAARPPRPGDVSICSACFALAVFTPFGVMLPDEETKAALEQREDVRKARLLLMAYGDAEKVAGLLKLDDEEKGRRG